LTSNSSFLGDLQEPFRWIADVTVMEAFESGVLDLPDFYFTGDDYRYRFETEAKRSFLDFLRERFNVGVRYNARVLKWDTVIERKTAELSRYLVGRSDRLDFSDPSPILSRVDSQRIRGRILRLSQSDAEKVGIRRSSLCHLRTKARATSSFKIYRNTLGRIGLASLTTPCRRS
jgi:CRISPR-associated protein Cas1